MGLRSILAPLRTPTTLKGPSGTDLTGPSPGGTAEVEAVDEVVEVVDVVEFHAEVVVEVEELEGVTVRVAETVTNVVEL